jgi:hypothetical protein
MEDDVDKALGWDVLVAKSVIVEPLLSVWVATVFEVVAADTPSPNLTVVAADSGWDTDVWFASSASSSSLVPAVLWAACWTDNLDRLLASAAEEDEASAFIALMMRDSLKPLMTDGGGSNLGLGR